MNQYQTLEKILGNKHCPACDKTLIISENFAICKRCGFSQELTYKDSKRNRNARVCVQYRKIETLITIE